LHQVRQRPLASRDWSVCIAVALSVVWDGSEEAPVPSKEMSMGETGLHTARTVRDA